MKIQVLTIDNNGNIYNYIDISTADKKAVSDEYLGYLSKQTSVYPPMLSDGLITFSNEMYNGKSIPKMTVYNKDGSLAKMCGNGLRGFILFMLENNFLKKTDKSYTIDILTDSGLLTASYNVDDSSQITAIETLVGSPHFINNGNAYSFDVFSKQLFAYGIDIGNHHIIFPLFAYCKMDLSDLQNYPLEQLFKKTHEILYPASFDINKEEVNVTVLYAERYPASKYTLEYGKSYSEPLNLENDKNFFNPNKKIHSGNNPPDIYIRTWERGAGETLSCGTASASSAFLLTQLFFDSQEYTMHHKGGILKNKIISNNVFQSGSSKITGKHIIKF